VCSSDLMYATDGEGKVSMGTTNYINASLMHKVITAALSALD
jgi:hypothetical protein